MKMAVRKTKAQSCLWIACVVALALLVLPHPAAAGAKTSVTIELKEVSVRAAIKELERSTKMHFVYEDETIDNKKMKVTLSHKDARLKAVMEDFKNQTQLGYEIKGSRNVILLFNAPSTKSSSSSSAHQQPVDSKPPSQMQELRGNVIDAETRDPIGGAMVFIENSSIGTAADANGFFTLSIPAETEILSVQFVGYKKQRVNVKNKATITVGLDYDIAQVEEVVVTGMFERKHNTYSGAVSTIKADDMQRTGSLNVLEAVSQLDPSFQILINDDIGSNPNAMPDIQMRGAASFSDMKDNYTSSPNQPLFIVDGFEQSLQRVMDMDMYRVESVTLLKDATAKAIYGAKGANGVVVIETVKPEAGVLRFSYSFDLNVQTPVLRDYDRTNAREKLEVERLAGMYTSSDPKQQLELDRKYEAINQEILRGVNTDWLAQPTRVGVGQKHSLNMDGGDDRIRYDINLGLNDISGVMKGSYRRTFEGGFNFQYRYKSVVFRNQFTIVTNKGEESPYGSFEDYAKMNPYWRVRDARGHLVDVLGTYERYRGTDLDGDGVTDTEFPIYNPMINATTNYLNQDRYSDITNNFYVEWTLPHGFRLTGRLGVDKRESKGDLFYPSNYGTLDPNSPYNYRGITPDSPNDAYNKRGKYTKTHSDTFKVSSDVTLSYSKTIGQHMFFFNGQYNVSHDKTGSESYTGIGFADNAKSISQAKEYEENGKPVGRDTKTNEMGVVASLNYSYDSRYMVDINYRASASSLFGANNRWGHFWSAGGGVEPTQREIYARREVVRPIQGAWVVWLYWFAKLCNLPFACHLLLL